jgi:alkanesulfonate monooxygenase SsuD/methylene tetrahydromethanopterin reductase-like flavin-dependent oxidoreductase (luciferase family)
VGPGSSARDYALVGVPFEQRWPRFDESIRALRSLLRRDADDFDGQFYATTDVALEPPPPRPGGTPVWVASWGSAAGLRRVARLGDGWLASGYNTTPERFGESRVSLAKGLPNGLATMWMYVTEDAGEADRVLTGVLAPLLNRPVEAIRDLALPIGPAELCAERISAFAAAGAERVFVWPLADNLRQLELFRERVVPLVESA